jgi:hypothetical protein
LNQEVEALEKRAEWLRLSTQEEMTKSGFLAFLGGVHSLDTFAGWLLGAGAAVLAIIISNLDAIAPHISVSTVREAGILFLCSAAAGALEKAVALWLGRQVEATKEIYRSFDEIFAKHERIEIEAERLRHRVKTLPAIEPVMKELAEPLGRFSRWFLEEAARKAKEDRLWGLKRLVKAYRLQSAMFVFEVLLFGAFGVRLILGIGRP